MPTTEFDYMQALLQGDELGLRKIYADLLPRIGHFIVNHGGSKDDARDIFQDALMVIYQKGKEGKFQLTSGFYTLLYGVVRKLWRNKLRKKTNQEVTFPDDKTFRAVEDLEEQMEQEEKGKLFWASFRKLGEDCQKLMKLFFERKKMDEITTIMNFSSVSYAKKRKFQCKEKLVKLVKSDSRFKELQLQ